MYLFFFCYFPSSAPVYWCNICCHFRLWHLIHMEYQATQTTKMFITAYGQFSYLVSHFMSSHSTINLKLLIFWFWYDWHQSCCYFWLCTTFSHFIFLWIFGVHMPVTFTFWRLSLSTRFTAYVPPFGFGCSLPLENDLDFAFWWRFVASFK